MESATTRRGLEYPDVIDLLGFDQSKGEVLLVMHESRCWHGGDRQLHELQEKFNAYASFVLDGEMLASHPELDGKAVRIELRCAHMPHERALSLLQLIRDQLALQEIGVEVVVRAADKCGNGCDCQVPDSRAIDRNPDAFGLR